MIAWRWLPVTLIPSVLRYAALTALILAFVGCGTTLHPQEPKLIMGTSEGGAILTKNYAHPGAIAVRHCAKYGKQYVLKNVGRAPLAGKYEDRDYILYFDCL